MKNQNLCAAHSEKIQKDEAFALKSWHELMKRGVAAYTEYRTEAAEIYLNSAIEICRLRLKKNDNVFFSAFHLEKPLSFAVQLYIDRSGHAYTSKFLSTLTDKWFSKNNDFLDFTETIKETFVKHITQVELQEREYMNARETQLSASEHTTRYH